MVTIHELNTKRLRLRQWQQTDLKPFAAINADPQVMEFYPKLMSEEESNQTAERFQDLIEQNGWGFWAIEDLKSSEFLGFVGLHKPNLPYPFAPCVEIGWRLKRDAWGKGFATEGSLAALDFAFNVLELAEILSFTSVLNNRSEAVMRRLGMINTGGNFQHPNVPDHSPLKEHVLYRMTRSMFSDIIMA